VNRIGVKKAGLVSDRCHVWYHTNKSDRDKTSTGKSFYGEVQYTLCQFPEQQKNVTLGELVRKGE
jgi:hypothetical protein